MIQGFHVSLPSNREVTGMYDTVVEKAGQEVVDMMYDACGLQK